MTLGLCTPVIANISPLLQAPEGSTFRRSFFDTSTRYTKHIPDTQFKSRDNKSDGLFVWKSKHIINKIPKLDFFFLSQSMYYCVTEQLSIRLQIETTRFFFYIIRIFKRHHMVK